MLKAAIDAEVADFLEKHAGRLDENGKGSLFVTGIIRLVKYNWGRSRRGQPATIPWLYLKGISTGDFQEALQSLLGEDAKGISANVVVRLKESWARE